MQIKVQKKAVIELECDNDVEVLKAVCEMARQRIDDAKSQGGRGAAPVIVVSRLTLNDERQLRECQDFMSKIFDI